jgi:imidazole glycerol-phosphate synthase subunit HisH
VKPNVVLVDLGIGNIRSLTAALSWLGAVHEVTTDPTVLDAASHVLLPGVGAFDAAMDRIDELGLRGPLRAAANGGKPLLGVCLGMQLLFEESEEGAARGLGLAPGRVVRLEAARERGIKVPHVGFSPVYGHRSEGLFDGLGPIADFYFTHSYAAREISDDANAGFCDHACPFLAAFERGNLCGVQFHPEKSQSTGLALLSNFLGKR